MKIKKAVIPFILLAFFLALFGNRCYTVVDAGHVGVKVLFGKVEPEPLREGFHLINPLLEIRNYDARQKTHQETANVPSMDQLTTTVDVSVQYRINATMASKIAQETGTAAQTLEVHLVPKLRSVLREQGKSVKRAEDFFLESTQTRLQATLTSSLRDYLTPKGIDVQNVLIRDIKLPPFIMKAIESKKEREQEAEKQKAELERFKTEQEQLVAKANAEKEAAEKEAEKVRILADARAYEIEAINKAIKNNPAYVQIRQIEAFEELSKNSGTKMFFFDSQGTSPLPFINLGSLKNNE